MAKAVKRRWSYQTQEAKRHVPRKEAMSLKLTVGNIDTITQEYAEERRLFVSTAKERDV